MRLRTLVSPLALRHKFSTVANDGVRARGRTAIKQSSEPDRGLAAHSYLSFQGKTACGTIELTIRSSSVTQFGRLETRRD
jgi:hypothetical protein